MHAMALLSLALPSLLPKPAHIHAHEWYSLAWPDACQDSALMLTSGSYGLEGEISKFPSQAHMR